MGSFALISPAKGQKQRPSPRLAKRDSILNEESPRTALVAGGAASLEVFKYTQVCQEEFAHLEDPGTVLSGSDLWVTFKAWIRVQTLALQSK